MIYSIIFSTDLQQIGAKNSTLFILRFLTVDNRLSFV